ncbi:MAG: hypothetical protein O6920_02505, partial [Chloroflexi bacterium]|nr:hypothetical protein [Chloroflexota bacterium]
EGRLEARVEVKGTGGLARLSAQFNRMAAEIQSRIHQQEVMTTAISHELKTPLTRLRLALDMALASEDPAQAREMLVEMDQDLDDLDELTAELLTLAKLTYSGETLELHRVALKEIFGRLIPKLAGLEPRVAFSLEGATGAHCLGHAQPSQRAQCVQHGHAGRPVPGAGGCSGRS